MFSAYDIKKIVPRAIFALIAANLSWSLLAIVVSAVNFLGDSIESIILAPFSSSGLTTIQLDGNSAVFVPVAAAAIGLAAVGLLPVVGLAVAGIFGVFFAFIIVLIRRVILTFMLILAPIAIALSVFPQTEKIFKEWWEWFFKILLMYPFIMAMFAISRVSAGIISSPATGSGASGALLDIAAIAIIILPYFMIGKALSMAGGTMGKVAGFVNNRDKGTIDKAKQWDSNRVGANREKAKIDRFGSDNVAARGANSILRRVSNPRSMLSLNRQKRLGALQAGAGAAESGYAERYKAGFESLSDSQKDLLANSGGTDSGTKRYIKAEADKAYDKAYEKAIDGGSSVDEARVAAKMAKKAKDQSLQRDAHILTERVGGINKASARIAFRSAAAGMDTRTIDDLSAQLVTGGSTPWTQRSRVASDELASSASGAAAKAMQQKHDEAAIKLAAAMQGGDADMATFYSSQLQDLRDKATKGGLNIDLSKGKIDTSSDGFYTGKPSAARVTTQDALLQMGLEAFKGGDPKAQAQRIATLGGQVAAGAVRAAADVAVTGVANGVGNVPIVGGLDSVKSTTQSMRGSVEGGKEDFHGAVIGRKP